MERNSTFPHRVAIIALIFAALWVLIQATR